MRTWQKQKCTTFGRNTSKKRYTPVNRDRKLPAFPQIHFPETPQRRDARLKTRLAWILLISFWPANLPEWILVLGGYFFLFFFQFRVFQRRCSQNSKQTVQGRQWKGTNEQLSPVALFPLTAPNQEPAFHCPASPPPPDPLPEPYPGVGKGVWMLGSNFGFDFLNMRDSAVWRLAAFCKKSHPKIEPKNRTPMWKIRAKIRTRNSATELCTTKSASNLQPKSSVNLQGNTCRAPQRVSKRSRGVPPEVSLFVAPKSVTKKKNSSQKSVTRFWEFLEPNIN